MIQMRQRSSQAGTARPVRGGSASGYSARSTRVAAFARGARKARWKTMPTASSTLTNSTVPPIAIPIMYGSHDAAISSPGP